MVHQIQFPTPVLKHLMTADFLISKAFELGFGADGAKTIEAIEGGSVHGQLSGTFKNGSAHWNTIHADGVCHIDGKYIIETAAHEIIPCDVCGTLLADGVLKYRMFFHTGAKRWEWLNHVIAIAVGQVQQERYHFDCYVLGDHANGDENARAFFPVPRLEHLYYIQVEVSEFLRAGDLPEGSHMVIPISGGRFEGEKLKGNVEALGADWNYLRQGIPVKSHISTRYLLRTDDGALISLFTDGQMRMGIGGMLAMLIKKPDPLKCYFKQHLMFTAADPRYTWLNDALCVATVANTPDMKVCYDAYQIVFEPHKEK